MARITIFTLTEYTKEKIPTSSKQHDRVQSFQTGKQTSQVLLTHASHVNSTSSKPAQRSFSLMTF